MCKEIKTCMLLLNIIVIIITNDLNYKLYHTFAPRVYYMEL